MNEKGNTLTAKLRRTRRYAEDACGITVGFRLDFSRKVKNGVTIKIQFHHLRSEGITRSCANSSYRLHWSI